MFSILENAQLPETLPTTANPFLRSQQILVKTVPALRDVMSDPARNDLLGSDWTSEGGATVSGPATHTFKITNETV